MLDPSEEATSIKITHLEMLKGVGHHAYDDVLEVPIIDNRPTEDQLADQLEQAILKFPKCNAVLVRRHGSKTGVLPLFFVYWTISHHFLLD